MSLFWGKRWSMIVAFLVAATSFLDVAKCQSNIYTWRRGSSVAVLKDHLYMIGGSSTAPVTNMPIDGFKTVNGTIVIPLNKSWSIKDVSLDPTLNEGFEPSHKMALWPSEDGTKIYTWGGIGMGNGISPRWNKWSSQPRLRSFTPREAGEARGEWAVEEIDPPVDASSQRILRTGYGAWTSCNGLGFYMGGTVQNMTDGTYKGRSVRMPGLVIYNMTDGKWFNQTVKGIGYGTGEGTFTHGTAVCLPKAGTDGKGVVMFISGITQNRLGSTDQTETVTMEQVTFYDIGSASFHTQPTSGDATPKSRREYVCTVATTSSQDGRGAYEVVLFGGREQSPAQMHVLTVPGFRWFSYGGGSGRADTSRTDQSCAVIGRGQRQMISIGGIPAGDQNNKGGPISFEDPWRDNMKILDLTTMEWGDSYNHEAPSYKQPAEIRDWYSNPRNLEAVQFTSAVRSIFSDSIDNLMQNPPESPSGQGSPPVAAIAGGVVGGIAAIALAAACIFYFCRYKPKRARLAQEQRALIDDERNSASPTQEEMLKKQQKQQQQQLQELEVLKSSHEMVDQSTLSTLELHGNPSPLRSQMQPPQELQGSPAGIRRG